MRSDTFGELTPFGKLLKFPERMQQQNNFADQKF
jgi:hypothetical protein